MTITAADVANSAAPLLRGLGLAVPDAQPGRP